MSTSDWLQNLKDAFFVLGSLAGLVAVLRPVMESKHQRDIDRALAIISNLNERAIMDLERCVYAARRVPESCLLPLADLMYKLEEGRQEVRFTGPLKIYLFNELQALAASYMDLRKYVQVPEWELRSIGHEDEMEWVFNKSIFFRDDEEFPPDPDEAAADYGRHLEVAATVADNIKRRFQRFQALTELHFFEALFARIIVPRRMRAIGLEM